MFKILALIFLVSCSSLPTEKSLTISEQINEDSQKVQSFSERFKSKTEFVVLPKAEKFLTDLARRVAAQQPGFESEFLVVRIHNDQNPQMKRFFSFPGTFISVPYHYLLAVEFENEVAASLALEVAHVVNRNLAMELEKSLDFKEFFGFSDEQRLKSIQLGTRFLYYAGFDLRGMASIFERFPEYYADQNTSELNKMAIDFNLRSAQRARSEYLPSLKPTVRSAEFIQFKKELMKK